MYSAETILSFDCDPSLRRAAAKSNPRHEADCRNARAAYGLQWLSDAEPVIAIRRGQAQEGREFWPTARVVLEQRIGSRLHTVVLATCGEYHHTRAERVQMALDIARQESLPIAFAYPEVERPQDCISRLDVKRAGRYARDPQTWPTDPRLLPSIDAAAQEAAYGIAIDCRYEATT